MSNSAEPRPVLDVLTPSTWASIEKVIAEGFDTVRGPEPLNYDEALKLRRIPRKKPQIIVQRISDKIAKRNLLAIAAFSVAISLVAGFIFTCRLIDLSNDCHKESFTEKRTPVVEINGKRTPLPIAEGDQAKSSYFEIVREHLTGPSFNSRLFSGMLFISAFVLAFARWQVSNKQSAMSEIFERKRTSNMYILSNESATKDLISGAMEIREKRSLRTKNMTYIGPEQARTLLKQFLVSSWGEAKVDFKHKMFVYLELDNLEFAHMKYEAGYLDPEQMYRACEIFESRCQSKLFRHIAATQGLEYYTNSFKGLLVSLLILGFAESEDNYAEITPTKN